MTRSHIIGIALLLGGAAASEARAGEFDARGNYLPDPDAVVAIGFDADFDAQAAYYVTADQPEACVPSFAQVETGDALEGTHVLHVDTKAAESCAERFRFALPKGKASYVARVWMRHGSADLQVNIAYQDGAGIDDIRAKMGPTGRVTSDGWVEMVSNPLPVDGDRVEAAYLRVIDFDDQLGSDIDAFEMVPDGTPYWASQPCSGYGDDVCGEGAVCSYRKCVLGRTLVPPVPKEPIRSAMVDSMQGQLRTFFGGRKTRLENLPDALARLDAIRDVSDGWAFWNGWAHAIRLLQDWHTSPTGSVEAADRDKRLNACFFQGVADASQAQWASDPVYPDVLVSHVGVIGSQGLSQGDRLVSVDGLHPIAWALTLAADDWGWWQANSNDVYSELLERMRGLILRYAREYSVIHCHQATQSCDDVPTTYVVAELDGEPGPQVRCDNRPFYHVSGGPGENHNVGFNFFRGKVIESSDEEAIYSLVWDSLYGGGNPNGHVNKNLTDAFEDFKQNARGVVLDHRAGSGGTLDGAETATFLIRPPTPVLVFTSPIEFGNWDGPEDLTEGLALFAQFKSHWSAVMTAGHDSYYDPDMPVALLIHRDGSASDFMPYAFKNVSPKVRVFGPTATAGAFSTYHNFSYWGGIGLQFGSGDSIGADGKPLIGHGVVPDEIVVPKQSDLLAGKDTIHEAALAWLRTELKP